MILIFILLVSLMIAGIMIIRNSYEYDFVGMLLTIFSGLMLFIAVIGVPINYYGTVSEINQYHAIKTTIEQARTQDISDIERAALTTKIAEANQWLANARYWNNTIFDIYWPDEIMDLEPLK